MKNRFIAFFFAWFLGGVGINNFYTGKTFLGVVDVLFCWTGIPALVNVIRGICYLWCNSNEEFVEKYCTKPAVPNTKQ